MSAEMMSNKAASQSASANAAAQQAVVRSVPKANSEPKKSKVVRADVDIAEIMRKVSPDKSERVACRAEENQENITEQIKSAASSMNSVLSGLDKDIQFKVHEETSQLYVEVVNKRTKEVLRTWPPQEMLDVMARMHDVLGMLLDAEG